MSLGAEKSTPLSPRLKVAQDFKKVVGRTTESYSAYGGTEDLYKECSRQADYTIPQLEDPEAEALRTEDGEDLGVGQGWWYTSKTTLCSSESTCLDGESRSNLY